MKTQHKNCEALSDSIEQETTRFDQALTAWRTSPTSGRNELSALVDIHKLRVCEIQEQQIAQWMDAYERYADESNELDAA